MISSDPKTEPGHTRQLAALFNNEGGSVPECRAEIGGRDYRFIDPAWQPGKGHPMHPEYQSPAWAAHEVLVLEDGGADIWRTLTEAEAEELNGALWEEVYEAIRQWARGW